MVKLRLSPSSSPHVLVLTTGSIALVVLGVVGLAVTQSVWLLVVTVLAMLLATAALTVEVERQEGEPTEPAPRHPGEVAAAGSGPTPGPDFIGPRALHRVLVITRDALTSADVTAAADLDSRGWGTDELGVMVVALESSHGAWSDDQRDYGRARSAVDATVAALRRTGIRAAGHVGDRDEQRAVDDALTLFPADLVVPACTWHV